MKLFKIIMLIAMTVMMSGCASLWSLSDSRDEISSNRRAFKAVPMDNGGAGVGVDLFSLDTISQHPVRQGIAALADAASIYATYAVTKSVTSSHDGDSTTGRDSVNITGDGNTVNVGNSSTENK